MSGASGDEDDGATQLGESTGADASRSARVTPELERGGTAGRYVILERLGTGGMGVVYAAYDPELDRKVALKLVRADRRDAEQRGRLVREAQALARLRHANVVTVHDVGMLEDQVFVAMEFVAGQTLGVWARAIVRPRREILEVLCAAGRGVAAAHAAGLVHRDLKPDNVMVRDDGSACVMDFGLARADGELVPVSTEPAAMSASAMLRTDLTTTGTVMGTPAYMAPEQHRGAAADPRTDQFSFCVMLYELLYGERPFHGENAAGIAAAVTLGKLRDAPSGAGVPGWLRAVVVRGLAVRQDDRWPSMEALLAALERDPTRARRKWLLAAGAAAVVVTVPAVVLVSRERAQTRCTEEGARIDEVWNDDARQRLRGQLSASGGVSVEETIQLAMPWLDAHADDWRASATELCRRARIAGDFAPALVPHAEACLDDSRLAFAGLLEVLGEGARASDAVRAAANLDRVGPCVDPAWLELHPFPIFGGADQDAVVEVRRGLARSSALQRTARFDEAKTLLESLRGTAQDLGDEGLLSRVEVDIGTVAHALGDLDGTEKAMRSAFALGARSGQIESAAAAAIDLVYLEGIDRERPDLALVWNDVAIAMLESLGEREGLLTSDRLTNVAGVYWARGELDAAADALGRSADIKRRLLGPKHPALASTLANLGLVLRKQGQADRAIEHYSEATAILEAAHGPGSPDVAGMLNNKGTVYLSAKRFTEAGECFERSLAIYERTLGPDHPDSAMAMHNIAMVRREKGDVDGAIDLFERALAIRKRAGVGPTWVAGTAVNLAELLVEDGRDRARALALAREARELLRGSSDPEKDAGIAEIDAWIAKQERG